LILFFSFNALLHCTIHWSKYISTPKAGQVFFLLPLISLYPSLNIFFNISSSVIISFPIISHNNTRPEACQLLFFACCACALRAHPIYKFQATTYGCGLQKRYSDVRAEAQRQLFTGAPGPNGR
jgi:hypothetical protein